jgi:RIO kinase 2
MHLDASQLRHLTDGELRTLTAVELGMRNHERVPVELVGALSGNRGARRALQVLLRHKLVHHESRPYESYRLTPLGYDYLALRALRERSSVCSVGGLIGTGKESDVHEVLGGVDGSELFVLKVHRLGRTSFRRARTKRGYCERTPFVPEEAASDVAAGSSGRLLPTVEGVSESERASEGVPADRLDGNIVRFTSQSSDRRVVANWLYLSRLAAQREYEALVFLYGQGLPVPEPIDANRHCVVQRLVQGALPLSHARSLRDPRAVFERIWEFQERLAELGLVHGDLNEFNVLVDCVTEQITVIDFPQMVPLGHRDALEMLERDRRSLVSFFYNRFGLPLRIERGLLAEASSVSEHLVTARAGDVTDATNVTLNLWRQADSGAEAASRPDTAGSDEATICGKQLANAVSQLASLAHMRTLGNAPYISECASASVWSGLREARDPTRFSAANGSADEASAPLREGWHGRAASVTEADVGVASARSAGVERKFDTRAISRQLQAEHARCHRKLLLREATRLGKAHPRAARRAVPTTDWS